MGGGVPSQAIRNRWIAAIRRDAPPIDVYRGLDFTLPGLISEQSIAQGGIPLPVPDPRAW